MLISFHANITQPHQLEHAEWFKQGFKKHGIDLNITADIKAKADIHVISGPHYAQNYLMGHPRVIMIDREYYHNIKPTIYKSMDWVSVGWMRNDGGRIFKIGSGREPIRRKNRAANSGSLFLADYDGPMESANTIRLHPARAHNRESLLDCLHRHARASGYRTSALITAGLEGLEVTCLDSRSIMFEPNWLELLPYTDWHYSEIANGDLWQHLQL